MKRGLLLVLLGVVCVLLGSALAVATHHPYFNEEEPQALPDCTGEEPCAAATYDEVSTRVFDIVSAGGTLAGVMFGYAGFKRGKGD